MTNCGMTFWCLRHQRNEPIEDAPWESQLRGVLWVDRCEGDTQLYEDTGQLPTPNEPDERLEPIYAALRRMGREIHDLKGREQSPHASEIESRRRDIRVDLGDGQNPGPG